MYHLLLVSSLLAVGTVLTNSINNDAETNHAGRCTHRVKLAEGPEKDSSRITALEVAPSSGVLYGTGVDQTDDTGFVVVYNQATGQLRRLPMSEGADNKLVVSPRALSLMEVGDAKLIIAIASARTHLGVRSDEISVWNVIDPLSSSGLPTAVQLLHKIQTVGHAHFNEIRDIWAAWPQGIYVTSCKIPSSDEVQQEECQVLWCLPSSASTTGADQKSDWKREAAIFAQHRYYECQKVLPAIQQPKSLHDHRDYGGVAGSPLFNALITTQMTENNTLHAIALGRDRSGSQHFGAWIAGTWRSIDKMTTASEQKMMGPGTSSVDVGTGEMIISVNFNGSAETCSILSLASVPEHPGREPAVQPLRQIFDLPGVLCGSAVRMPPLPALGGGQQFADVGRVGVAVWLDDHSSAWLYFCDPSQSLTDKHSVSSSTDMKTELR